MVETSTYSCLCFVEFKEFWLYRSNVRARQFLRLQQHPRGRGGKRRFTCTKVQGVGESRIVNQHLSTRVFNAIQWMSGFCVSRVEVLSSVVAYYTGIEANTPRKTMHAGTFRSSFAWGKVCNTISKRWFSRWQITRARSSLAWPKTRRQHCQRVLTGAHYHIGIKLNGMGV